MTLIKSISGIRGTIGGKTSDNLTPIDAVKFASAYGTFIKNRNPNKEKITVVIGRDARISGKMISSLVANTLVGLGINVIDLGLSTTPTVEVAVPLEKADGGIILTASHNPKQWNALKLLNEKGEFLNGEDGEVILETAESDDFDFADVDDLGTYSKDKTYLEKHIQEVLNLELVDVEAIRNANFKVVVDGVNSTGGIFIPALLKELNVACIELYCEPNGDFPHNPEPLKEHLTDISELVVKEQADFGIVVDPDVDRLALICEDGSMFGEEYTLVACADYVLGRLGGGNTVSHLARIKTSCKDLRESYPSYFMSKNKIQLTPRIDVDQILETMATKYANEDVNTIDGVKIDFENEWIHLRKSNTEPIIRIYTESNSQVNADALAERFISEIKEIIA